MAKKNSITTVRNCNIDSIVGWKMPVFHQASECYVSVTAYDPSLGRMRKKKIMLNHIRGKKEQRIMGAHIIRELTAKLLGGWNPWIEAESPIEYTLFEDVCLKYEQWLLKVQREGGIREETLSSYLSKLNIDILRRGID